MENQTIQIESIRAKDLYDFACRCADQARQGEVLPISRQRALSWSRNPHADPDDVVLHVAYCQGRCVGYRGHVPVRLDPQHNAHKFLWVSSWYVVPEFRTRGVALKLYQHSLSLNTDLLVAEPSEASETFHRCMGWRALPPIPSTQIEVCAYLPGLNFPVRLLGKALKMLGLQFRLLDSFSEQCSRLSKGLANWILYRVLLFRVRDVFNEIGWRQVANFSQERKLKESMLSRSEKEASPSYRDLNVIDWMLAYPWFPERLQQLEGRGDYSFTLSYDDFRYIPVVIFLKERQDPVAFALFSLITQGNGTKLKVLDFGPNHPHVRRWIAGVAIRYGDSHLAKVIEFSPQIAESLGFSWPIPRISRQVRRTVLVHTTTKDSPLTRNSGVAFNLWDGELGFW